jgi:hypothetical protein
MLRISMTESPIERRWILEGRLVEPWLAELRASWRRLPRPPGERKFIVDLTEVTAIDKCGEKLLRSMARAGAEFIARGVYTKHIVDSVKTKGKRWLPSCFSLFLGVFIGIASIPLLSRSHAPGLQVISQSQITIGGLACHLK